MKLKLAIAGVVALVATSAAFAHHRFSDAYDASAPMTWSGKILKIDMCCNPHGYIDIEVPGTTGPVTWRLQTGQAVTVRGAVSSATGAMPGSKSVTTALDGKSAEVRGYRAKGVSATCSKDCSGTARSLVVNGKAFFVGSTATEAPRDGADPREP